jgi:hypothetical protein
MPNCKLLSGRHHRADASLRRLLLAVVRSQISLPPSADSAAVAAILAVVAIMLWFQGSDMYFLQCECLLLTQSGHAAIRLFQNG